MAILVYASCLNKPRYMLIHGIPSRFPSPTKYHCRLFVSQIILDEHSPFLDDPMHYIHINYNIYIYVSRTYTVYTRSRFNTHFILGSPKPECTYNSIYIYLIIYIYSYLYIHIYTCTRHCRIVYIGPLVFWLGFQTDLPVAKASRLTRSLPSWAFWSSSMASVDHWRSCPRRWGSTAEMASSHGRGHCV